MHVMPKRQALVLSILLALPPAVLADDAAPADAASLDRIIVKGRKSEPRTGNQNVRQIHHDTLRDEMANSMEDVVRYTPGVEIVDMGRFGDNGFNIRGMEADRVSLTIDGLSFAESLETARDYEFFRAGRGGLDIDTLKSVEVVKGADSISAGSGALGGAIAFTSKDPADYLAAGGNDTHIGLKLGYASSNEQKSATASFANRTGIVESMLVHTRRKGHETESWYADTPARTGSDRRLPDPVDSDSDNWLAKLDVRLGGGHVAGVVYERARVGNVVENLTRVSPPGYLERWGFDDTSRDRYGLHWRWNGGKAMFDTVEAQADMQKTASSGLTRIISGRGCPGGVQPCWRQEDRSSRQAQRRIAADFTKAIEGATVHRIAYGLAWQRRDVDFSATDTRWRADGSVASIEIDPAQVPETSVKTWNLYLQDRIRLADDRLGLVLGARYDRYDYNPELSATFADPLGAVKPASFAAPSWQAGLDWRIAEKQTLWLQTGHGFRAPTVADMYAPVGYTDATIVGTGEAVRYWTSAPNPDLKSETSLNLELGWRWQSRNAMWGISAFRDRYSDFIEWTQAVRNPGTQYNVCDWRGCRITQGNLYNRPENLGAVTVKGYEIGGRVRMGQAWLLRAAWSRSAGKDDDGMPLDSINPARGVLGLRWQSPQAVWSLTGNLTHAMAKRQNRTTQRTDPFTGQAMQRFLSRAWSTFDLIASFKPDEHWRVNAGIYNLFDREYATWPRIRMVGRGDFALYGYATDAGYGRLTEPGRNVRLSVAYDF